MEDRSQIDQRGQRVIGQQINVAGDATLPPPPLILVPHLPAPPRDFTGRDEELQDLLAGFDRGATITGLRGMGGVGKTALAYVLAERLVDRYPDGQILLELRGTSPEPMTAEEAMARIIRARHPEFKLPESEDGLASIYHSLLHDLRVLLLLDNAASREQVEPLLPPSGCAAIVTSRKRFVMPGLKPKDLDVLPLEDAKKLLLEIADRIGGQAEELARLCGCLPIALRNAASVLAERIDLGVAEYLERLQEAKNRVELVEASFGLSYDLLSPELRGLWCLLYVFPPGAGFDREGAAAVWALDQDSAASSLSDLVKWSLVEYDPAIGRYRLHDLARDYVASRLQTREKADAEERHAEHYRSVLSASDEQYMKGGENVLAGLALFNREWANIQAGQSWAEKNLENSPAAASLCSSYPGVGAYILDLRLHPRELIRWLETAVTAAKQRSDRGAEGSHLSNLGAAYYALGEPRKAIYYHYHALKIFRDIGSKRGESAVLGNLGAACKDLGEPHKAIDYHNQSLKIAREIGDRQNEGNQLGNLGSAYATLVDPSEVIEYCDQALEIAREIGDKRNECVWLGNLGNCYNDLGETCKAIEYYDQALEIAREIGDKRNECGWLGNLGNFYDDLGETRKAIEYFEQALTISREIGDRRGEENALVNIGIAYAELDEPRKAIEYFEQALTISREIGDRKGEENILGNMGIAFSDLDEPSRAIEHYEQALTISREIGDRRGEGNSLWNMSLELDDLRERKQAIEYARAALDIWEEIEDSRAEQVRRQLAEWQRES